MTSPQILRMWYVCVCAYVHKCVYVHMYVHMYVCICMYVCMYVDVTRARWYPLKGFRGGAVARL